MLHCLWGTVLPNPGTVFPYIMDIKLITKLLCFINWQFWQWVETWREILKIPWTAAKHRWRYSQNPVCLLLQPFSGISGKRLSGLSLLILCSEFLEFVCPNPSEWKIGVWKTPDFSRWDLLSHNIWVCFQLQEVLIGLMSHAQAARNSKFHWTREDYFDKGK